MGKKSKRKVTTKKPPVSESGVTNDDGPTLPQLQHPRSILNSIYMAPYISPGLSRDLEEFGLNNGYIPFGLGTIPCARRSNSNISNVSMPSGGGGQGEISAYYSRPVAAEGTYFAPSGYSTDLTEPCPEFFTQIQSFMKPHVQEERRRIGSSCGTSREIAEAEIIATDARVLKKARQNKEAHDMYTEAIKIDPYNHGYFHHRAETAFGWKKWEWARCDAQAGLDLCVYFIEDHASDEMFGMLWCTLTRAHMEMNEWKKAKQSCGLGLQYIDDSVEETQYAVKVLRMYKKDIHDQIDAYNASPLSSIAEYRVYKVQNENDTLMFAYTSKIEREKCPAQPELLLVDLDVNISPTLWRVMFDTINEQKLRNWTQTPLMNHETIPLPGINHWLTAIPILSSEDVCVIKKHLMRDSVESSTVVIIKVEEATGPPDFDTTAYIRTVTENAVHCERMYGEGRKLAD